MYWRQALLAAGCGVALGAVAHRLYAASILEAVALALTGYVSIRILLGAYHRTRYWLDRSNKRQSRSCGNCGEYIYRRRGDLLLRCGRCGWTAGWPGLRWATHSVPARQVIRSITWQRLGVIALAGLLVVPFAVPVGGGVGGAAGAGDGASAPESVATTTSTPSATATATTSDSPLSPSGSTVENRLVDRINTYRDSRGENRLERETDLDEMAEYHSQDMIEDDYYAHTSPGGETVKDRFQEFAPQCRGGSENIHRAELRENMRIYQSDTTVDTTTVDGLTTYFFKGWQNSDGHRENMLNSRWTRIGIGVGMEGGDVYATVVFC